MMSSERFAGDSVTLRVWKDRREAYQSWGDPDETHDLELHAGRWREAPYAVLSDSIRERGWMAFDLVDLPDGLEMATLMVHATDSFHDPDPFDEDPVERGLVFDGDYLPGEDPPCYGLDGMVYAWAFPGAR